MENKNGWKIRMQFSTGIWQFDEVLQGVLPGDNVVFQVDEIDDFKCLGQPDNPQLISGWREGTYQYPGPGSCKSLPAMTSAGPLSWSWIESLGT